MARTRYVLEADNLRICGDGYQFSAGTINGPWDAYAETFTAEQRDAYATVNQQLNRWIAEREVPSAFESAAHVLREAFGDASIKV